MSGCDTMQMVGSSLAVARAVRASLEESLGHEFTLWVQPKNWQVVEETRPQGAAGFDLTSLGEALRKQPLGRCSTVIPLQADQHLLTIPVRAQDSLPVLLVGLVDPVTASLARSLADSLVQTQTLKSKLDATAQQLDQCIFQITANFEELTWLRSLSAHFEICSLQNGLSRAAGATLPALRQLIYAQELFFFGMPYRRDMVPDTAQDKFAVTCTEIPLLSFDGDGDISEAAARNIIRQQPVASPKQTIVWNSTAQPTSPRDPRELRNYILMPVLKCGEQLGWLLAINKNMPLEERVWNDMESTDQNLIEFGTTEAGLLSTMAVMLATHGKNVELLKEQEALLVGVIRALVNTIDAKDAYTCGHSDRVASMSKRIAQQLGHSDEECEQAYMGGLLHDIGKIGVPDQVLGKATALTDEEYKLVQMHPTIGVGILKHLKPFSGVLPGVLHHHESYDGRGYPDGLVGEKIPLLGRIIAVADSYDAMTSSRTYRPGMPTEKAETILRGGIATQWDRRVIEAFFAALTDIHVICGLAPPPTNAGCSLTEVVQPVTCPAVPPTLANC